MFRVGVAGRVLPHLAHHQHMRKRAQDNHDCQNYGIHRQAEHEDGRQGGHGHEAQHQHQQQVFLVHIGSDQELRRKGGRWI